MTSNGLMRGTAILGGLVTLLASLLVAPAGRASVQPTLTWGPCGDDVPAVLRYLTDGTLPAPDTVCKQSFDPFPG